MSGAVLIYMCNRLVTMLSQMNKKKTKTKSSSRLFAIRFCGT